MRGAPPRAAAARTHDGDPDEPGAAERPRAAPAEAPASAAEEGAASANIANGDGARRAYRRRASECETKDPRP
jgi:hypothetical protein